MNNFPTKFKMEPDLRKCIGKTITNVELLKMEYGCTWNEAFAVEFTDGSRAFFAGHPGTGIMNPDIDGQYTHLKTVETSQIFTKREYAEMVAAREAEKLRRKQDVDRREREEFEKLATKYGAK